MLDPIRRRFSAIGGRNQTTILAAGSILVFTLLFGSGMAWRHYSQKRHEARMASQRMSARFLCSTAVRVDGEIIGTLYYFPNSNITDADLAVFEDYFNGYGSASTRRPVVQIDIKGSPVSEAAIARFRRNVPECEIIP
ncbi:MAG: hypothetical protein CMJ46_15780 [Planctomyces sp.]|nr:hypothetical protein [Planctomyces sp.]